tara:strand:+ start:1497 stop:1697 length:201 start_codon:yes stop_codon:yes gene_type:complete
VPGVDHRVKKQLGLVVKRVIIVIGAGKQPKCITLSNTGVTALAMMDAVVHVLAFAMARVQPATAGQ